MIIFTKKIKANLFLHFFQLSPYKMSLNDPRGVAPKLKTTGIATVN